MIWRGDGVGGTGTYDPLRGLNHAWLNPKITPLNLDDPRLAAAAKRDKRVRAFLFWSRMPMVVRAGRPRLSDRPALLRVGPRVELGFPHPARQAVFEFITPPA